MPLPGGRTTGAAVAALGASFCPLSGTRAQTGHAQVTWSNVPFAVAHSISATLAQSRSASWLVPVFWLSVSSCCKGGSCRWCAIGKPSLTANLQYVAATVPRLPTWTVVQSFQVKTRTFAKRFQLAQGSIAFQFGQPEQHHTLPIDVQVTPN